MNRPQLDRTVTDRDDGQRLDAALADWLGQPRSRMQQRIAAGEVMIDGQPAPKSHRLREGERVVVAAGAPEPPRPPPPPVAVRYADDHVAVVSKPAGLVVHPGAGTHGPTLIDALQSQGLRLAPGTDPDRPGIVHRLDRGTSGLVVVAKTAEARDGLIAQLQARSVERRYWAIVEGVPEPPVATIDAPIGRSATNRTRFAIEPAGRPAITHYDVERRFGRAAVLSLRLETGRTHQVRVHMAAVGHPLAGDLAYGASPRLASELGLERPALHAAVLGFTHPVTGEEIRIEEQLPEDLRAALATLSGGDSR